MLDVSSCSKSLEGIVSAGETIIPGEVVQYLASAGTIERYHGVTLNLAALLIAVENTAQGLGVDDAYTAGQRIYFRHMRPGDLFLGRMTGIAYNVGATVGPEADTGLFTVSISGFNDAIAIVAKTDALTASGRLVQLMAK